jgi:hypothetical protein
VIGPLAPGRDGFAAGLRAALEKVGLPFWFLVIDLLWIAKPDVFGIDARHYQRAATEWLAGGDPWAVVEGGVSYASGPHTLLFYAPTSLLPLPASTLLWMIGGVVASVWLVRRLGLPLWWLLFPPLAHAMWNGNPQSVALALLVAGGSLTASLAVLIKLYAGIPLLGRWRDLVVAGTVLVVTVAVLPWQLYLDHGLGIDAFTDSWNGSAWRIPVLVPVVALSLWVLRRDGAQWLAVPALFPVTQFYYVAMALPAIRQRRLVAAALALPMILMTPIVVIVLAVGATRVLRVRARIRRQPSGPRGKEPVS